MNITKRKLHKGAVRDVTKIMWRHVVKHPISMGVILLATIAINAYQIILPLYYKKLVDVASKWLTSPSAIVPELISVFIVIIGLSLAGWCFYRLRGFTTTYFQSRVMADLSKTSFDYLIRHSHRFFLDNFAGSLVRKLNRLPRAFEDISDQVEFSLLPIIFTIIGILYVLFRRDTLLGVILSIGICIFIIFNFIVVLWKQKYEAVRVEKDSEATGVLADAITNSAPIKLFSGYGHEESLYRQAINNLWRIRFFTWNLNEVIDAVQTFMMFIINIGIVYVAIILWGRGILTVGDFLLIQLYLFNLFDKIFNFGRMLRRLFEGFADAAEMVDILNMPHEIKDAKIAKPLQIKKGEIKFQNVNFGFQKTRRVLNDFSLNIRAGEKVAFMGSSGAGKSTLALLLCRFYDVDSGKISIDGQEITAVTQESLWDNIAMVPQEPILFHRTIRENILYGRRDATNKEIIEAAKKAHCHEFINTFPCGYETYVGERGVKLSGGERQRVAIARAILKNPPILVLDEATSSLDSESESLIQDALKELMVNRTVLAIAHRLSTIRQMDRIIVIEDGYIIAEGSHEELLCQGGTYQRLWEIQAGKFLA